MSSDENPKPLDPAAIEKLKNSTADNTEVPGQKPKNVFGKLDAQRIEENIKMSLSKKSEFKVLGTFKLKDKKDRDMIRVGLGEMTNEEKIKVIAIYVLKVRNENNKVQVIIEVLKK